MMAKKPELVFLPATLPGHIVSAIELAKLLISRDDRLSITILLIKFPNSPSLNATGITFIELPQIDPPSPNTAQTPEAILSIFLDSHKPLVKDTITQLFLSSSESDSMPTRSRDSKLVGLVIDFFCTTMIDVANELGVPSYLFFTSTAHMLGVMLHLPVLDAQIHTDFEESDTELIIPGFTNPVPRRVLPQPMWTKNQDGYSWYLYHARRFREAKGIIVNTFEEFESHAVRSLTSDGRTPPLYPVGPLIDLEGRILNPDQSQFENIKRWLDDQPTSTVVFLCFGSSGSFSAPQVKEIALGLERSGHRFLWSIREPPRERFTLPGDYTNPEEVLPEGFLDRTAERGLLCGWVPQVAVLAHRAIGGFVSHCGWNSIMESFWFDVPIAGWPLYAEQHLNGFAMVKELGGLVVELKMDFRGWDDDLVIAEEVEKAVRKLMDADCEVRTKVKDISEKSRRALMDGRSSFISLERFIKNLMEEN
ncbi:anthocyanidin 3-O-glucosyltransferase 2-like [Macadamia integrifolia]|uniref:anthocyanidin 3-O-glucosyltransferase 2-like n=1 Tax=Macadamia integrifolia TaxID=60698 RepID=UPI001C4F7BC7|nr:anthocyanidin 3-O-glucosyltransferase 2-like [Macadamia integrifolia]